MWDMIESNPVFRKSKKSLTVDEFRRKCINQLHVVIDQKVKILINYIPIKIII